MNPGRELDLLVAEKVFGYRPCKGNHSYACQLPIGPCWIQEDGHGHMWEVNCSPYSTDIAAAWEVVEKLKEDWDLDISFRHYQSGIISVVLYHQHPNLSMSQHVGNATTAPLAICLAALKTEGVKI